MAQTVRKLGESLEKGLGMNKPVIATKVARWIAKHPGKLPLKLGNLVKWTVEGIIQGKVPQEHAE